MVILFLILSFPRQDSLPNMADHADGLIHRVCQSDCYVLTANFERNSFLKMNEKT